LFSGTIRENVLFSLEFKDTKMQETIRKYKIQEYVENKPIDENKLEELLNLSNSKEFVDQLSEKYDSIVGERGVRLSGGQKQRISIARSLANNPKILILDEATSALDANSEHLVNEAINEIMRKKDKTTIVIAHRLSTVKSADFVMMLDKGQILEIGTHEKLYAENGAYKNLVEKQMANNDSQDNNNN